MKYDGVNKKWQIDYGWLRCGKQMFWDPLSSQECPIVWEFSELTGHFSPLKIIRCKLVGFDQEAEGFGDGFVIRTALVKAFAEAWERVWFIRVGSSDNSSFQIPSSTNGFAAGSTNAMALEESQKELIDRTLVLTAWSQSQGWEKWKLKGFLSKFIKSFLLSQGWSTDVYKIAQRNLGAALAGVAYKPNHGIVFDSCYLDEPLKSEIKLLRSLLRLCKIKIKPQGILPDNASPKDHAQYYRVPEHVKAFDFLKTEKSALPLLEALPSRANLKSDLLTGVSNFPAVAYSHNADWPSLRWGRQSISGKNPWPHPIA